MNIFDSLVQGSIDMHVHAGPDSLVERRQDALQLARSAREAGMRAIVIKSQELNTVPAAQLATEQVPEVKIFGSITLNNEVGGLNPAVVLSAIRMGAKVVWMPTFSSANSKAKTEKALGVKLAGGELSILDSRGRLLPQVKEICRMVKDNDIVLATGHIPPHEIFALFEEAQRIGITKIVITHALQGQLSNVLLDARQIKQLADSGAFIEHSFWGLMPNMPEMSGIKDMVKSIKLTGAARCIMSTDFGQIYNPPAPEGMRIFIGSVLRNGLEPAEIELMVKTNPAKLVGY